VQLKVFLENNVDIQDNLINDFDDSGFNSIYYAIKERNWKYIEMT
jgi:hypothetical protein